MTVGTLQIHHFQTDGTYQNPIFQIPEIKEKEDTEFDWAKVLWSRLGFSLVGAERRITHGLLGRVGSSSKVTLGVEGLARFGASDSGSREVILGTSVLGLGTKGQGWFTRFSPGGMRWAIGDEMASAKVSAGFGGMSVSREVVMKSGLYREAKAMALESGPLAAADLLKAQGYRSLSRYEIAHCFKTTAVGGINVLFGSLALQLGGIELLNRLGFDEHEAQIYSGVAASVVMELGQIFAVSTAQTLTPMIGASLILKNLIPSLSMAYLNTQAYGWMDSHIHEGSSFMHQALVSGALTLGSYMLVPVFQSAGVFSPLLASLTRSFFFA